MFVLPSLQKPIADRSASTLPITKEAMTDPKGAKALASADAAGVNTRNTINVAMEDLIEEDRKEIERELEEEMAERRKRKLACF
jgi:hypothetical protein